MELQRLERTEKLQQEKIRKIENVSYQLQQELESDLLQYYEIEFTTLQKQYQDLQGEFKETAENLVRDKDFYKEQYELAQASESKIKKDLEEVQNILKLKTDELEDYKDRMQVNEKIITELNAKMKESNNIVKLKKKLKEERRLNEELIDTVQRLQKELRELHLSVRLDKQLMQVIENDEVVDGIATEDQKTNETRKDDLEIERDIMRHQIAEYEDRILQLKADLTEETKKVVKLDKELISERNAVEFLRTDLRRTTEELRAREQDCNHLQKQLKILTENKKQDQRDADLNKLKLYRKINDAREVRTELEADLNCTKQELKKSSEKLQKFRGKYLREKIRRKALEK